MFFISQNDSWIVVFATELMRRQLFFVAFKVSSNYSTVLHIHKCTLQTASFLPQHLIKSNKSCERMSLSDMFDCKVKWRNSDHLGFGAESLCFVPKIKTIAPTLFQRSLFFPSLLPLTLAIDNILGFHARVEKPKTKNCFHGFLFLNRRLKKCELSLHKKTSYLLKQGTG